MSLKAIGKQIRRGYLRTLTLVRASLGWLPKKVRQGFSAGLAVALIVLLIFGPYSLRPQFAQGAYTTSTTDADGNAHLASNTVNDTYFYDTTQDSGPATQQILGVDPNWPNGVVRESYALKYDGSTQYAAKTSFSGTPSAAPFTIEAWIYPQELNREQHIAEFGSVQFYLSSGNRIRVGDSSTTCATGSTAIALSTWYHVVGVFGNGASTGCRIYVNGVSDATGTTQSYGPSNTLVVGDLYTHSAGFKFNGIIDEVRVSTTERYSAAFTPQRRFKEDANTIGLYHFDEGTGSAAADSSQYGNDLTLTGSPTWVSGANAIMDGFLGCNPDTGAGDCTSGGRSGAGNITLGAQSSTTNDKAYETRITGSNGVTLDGSNDYIEKTDAVGLDLTGNITVEAWVNKNATPDDFPAIVSKGVDGSRLAYALNYDATAANIKFQIGVAGVSTIELVSTAAPTANEWHHIAGVADTSQLRIYIDGVLKATATRTLAIGDSAQSLCIGAYSNAANCNQDYLQGKIDEVRLSTVARYTSDFVPSRRFSNDGSTAALWHLDEGTGTTSADTSGNGFTGTLKNGTSNSPAADGTTNGPLWSEGIASTNDVGTSRTTSSAWALAGYQNRKQLKITNNVASTLGTGYGVETTLDRGATIDNKQSRGDGKDWRVLYQPTDATRSLSLDGSTDYVTLTNSSSLQLSTGTVEAWFKTSGAGAAYRAIVAKSNAYGVFLKDNVLMIYDWTAGADRSTGISITDNVWHHVAVTFQSGVGSGTKIYLDGALKTTTTMTVLNQNSELEIGDNGVGNSQNFNGLIDEVRVSSSIRYTGDFAPARTPFVTDSATAGLYHLDEGSGQMVRDSSGNDNNGVLGSTSAVAANDPTWSTDGAVSTIQEVPRFIPHGHTLSFDGTNDQVTDTTLSSSVTADVTAEAWFKSSYSGSDARRIFDLAQAGGVNGMNVYLYSLNGQVCIDNSGGPTGTVCTASGVYNDGAWHHVAAVRSGTTYKLYVDGVYHASGTGTAPTYTKLYVGSQQDNTVYFNGQIDDVRVSTTTRYRNNFTPSTTPFVKDLSTLIYWHFDDGSGSSTSDSSGNANTGTISGATWVTNGGKVDSINQTQFKTVAPINASGTDSNYFLYYGNLNEQGSPQSYNAYALKFNGNEYVLTTYTAALTDFTMVAWYKDTGTTPSSERIIDKNYSTGFWLGRATTGGATWGGGVRESVSPYGRFVSLTDGNWHQIASVRSGTSHTIYGDGGAVSTAGTVSGTATDGASLQFGTDHAGLNRLTGQISEVRLYTRALSSTEISALYSNTPTVSNSGLAAYWKFTDSAAAGTTLTDVVGGANGTLNGFAFDQDENWIVNANLLPVATEPTLTTVTTETETPIFYQWRQAGGSWSTRAQIPTTETQLGSEGVYLKFNPQGVYSRQDYYKIASWAVEAFTTSGPQRGKERAFPTKANLVADSLGINIINAANNKLWMRLTRSGSNQLINSITEYVTAMNGRMYAGGNGGNVSAVEVQFDLDTGQAYHSTGNGTYAGTIADRADSLGYTLSGTALSHSGSHDASVAVINNKQYVTIGTDDGLDLIKDITTVAGASSSTVGINAYGRAFVGDQYDEVFLTPGGELYGYNSAASSLDRFDNVQSDSSGQVGSADAFYTTSTTPALRSVSIFNISVTEGTSLAEPGVSNSVAVGTAVGTEVIQEHSTTASGFIEHYVRSGVVGSSSWSSKQFGNALLFDGSNDLVNIPTETLTGTTVTAFTAEAWIYPKASTVQAIVSQNGPYFLALGIPPSNTQGGKACATVNISSTNYSACDSSSITLNTWHHVAMTYDGADVKVYLDGTLKATTPIAGSITFAGGSTDKIGDSPGLSTPFNGYIDEVRLSSSLRYTGAFTPVSALFTADGNTAALWHLDGRTGQSVFDDTTNADDGTLGTNSSAGTDDPLRISPSIGGTGDKVTAVGLGKTADPGNDLSFDGGDMVNIGDKTEYKFTTGDWSMGIWFKTSSASVQNLWSKGNSGAFTEYFLELNASPGILDFRIGNSTCSGWLATGLNLSSSFTSGIWNHVYVVKSGSNASLYLNGALADTHALGSSSICESTHALRIGADSTGGNGFNGLADDFRVYNRALTGSEVAGLYNGVAGRTDNPYSGIVGWWKLNEGSGQTVSDSSGSANNGTLGANSSASTDDPTWSTGSPVKERAPLWVGSNDSSANDGAVTAISDMTQRQLVEFTSSNSGLPDNDVNALSTTFGGALALVGTNDLGAWNPGIAGFVVDDLASVPATTSNPIRIKRGVRLKGGTRLK